MSIVMDGYSWSEALWNHYLPVLQKGGPFHLAADDSLIARVAMADSLNESDPKQANLSFHAACNFLFSQTPAATWAMVRVKPEAFERRATGYSQVICLAVQQVLIVEEMLADEKFGAQAYFPRYRERIGLPGLHHSNPILSDGFMRIWDCLRLEILDAPGASDESITFERGTGMNRNRSLPFSQALLSGDDLTRLCRGAPGLSPVSADALIRSGLFRCASRLSGRGRRLAATSDRWIRERVCDQVRAFIGHERRSLLRTVTRRPGDQIEVVAYLNDEDLFSVEDRFDFCLQSGEDQVTGAEVLSLITERLDHADAILLSFKGDAYRELGKLDAAVVGDPLLVVCAAFRRTRLFAELNPNDHSMRSFESVVVGLGDEISALFSHSLTQGELSALQGTSAVKTGASLSFEGGLRPDRRRPLYIQGYPPTGIRFGDRILDSDAQILVDGHSRSLREFMGSLLEASDFVSFTLDVGDSLIQVGVSAVPQQREDERLGYRIQDNGEVSPVPELLALDTPSLRGAQLKLSTAKPVVDQLALSLSDLLLLLERGPRIAVPQRDLAHILAALGQMPDRLAVIHSVRRQISLSRSVPLAAFRAGVVHRSPHG